MNESLAITAVLGLSLGSFLNVCIYRIPRNISVISPRSFCPHCNRQLHWFELVPVGSYFLARGKCKVCSGKISITYPVNEVFVALLFVFLYYRYGMSSEFVAASAFSFLMLTVAIIDWKYFVVPNVLVLSGVVLGVLLKLTLSGSTIIHDTIAAILAFVTVFAIRYWGNIYFKKEAMGLGDVKLAALIGFFMGFQLFLVSLWLASLAGAIYGISRHVVLKHANEEKIPFGSFLGITSVIVMISHDVIDQLFERWLTLVQ